MKIYEYVGDGLGIPGLPHVVSEEQSKVYKADYDRAVSALRAEVNADVKAGHRVRPTPERLQLQIDRNNGAHPWRSLQGALENKSYREKTVNAPKAQESAKTKEA